MRRGRGGWMFLGRFLLGRSRGVVEGMGRRIGFEVNKSIKFRLPSLIIGYR